MLRIATTVTTVAALATAASCGGADDVDSTILVLAAASLTDAFADIEERFEDANPGLDVEISHGGSSSLRVQVSEGAPADVVAFADADLMADLASDGLVDTMETIATNALVLAVPADNPGDVASIDDLSDSRLLIGVCAPQVPCGGYAQELLDRAGVTASIDTEEPDVRALAAKVASGELDAGLVYATDVDAFDGDLATVPLPDDVHVLAEYPIARVADSASAAADSFIAFVLSEDGRRALSDAGFGLP
jgi:molybdate transport system substrate-binding protein